jgi:hypothetical protein
MPEPEPEYFLKQAIRCRSIASFTRDKRIRQTLLEMADDYERRAEGLQQK